MPQTQRPSRSHAITNHLRRVTRRAASGTHLSSAEGAIRVVFPALPNSPTAIASATPKSSENGMTKYRATLSSIGLVANDGGDDADDVDIAYWESAIRSVSLQPT